MNKPIIDRGFIFFVLIFFSVVTTFAKQYQVSYTDVLGNKWNRWILLEQQEQRILFLVVDSPEKEEPQRFTNQVIVERSTITGVDRGAIQAKVMYYQDLKDLEHRSVFYYQENEEKLDTKPNPLWTIVKENWDIDDENKFSVWFKKNASTKMALGSGVEFDCADFALLGRWIYAHDNKLPIVTSLAGSGKLFGHFSESKTWSHLPTNPEWKKDERFKAALRYLFDSTYTRSILNDLYPIKISSEYVTPGSIILTLRSNGTGHTQVIYDVGRQSYCGAECISVLFGNQPSREYAYLTQADIRYNSSASGGFLKWRWPQFKNGRWYLLEKSSMPGYSLEQYEKSDMSFDEFHNYIYESLGFKIKPYRKAYSLAKSLYNDLNDRLVSTAQGAVFCHYQYCDPQGVDFDQYSTPSKDSRFREKRDQLLRLLASLTPAEQRDLVAMFEKDIFIGRHAVPVFYSDYIFNKNGISDRMASDAHMTFEARWGLDGLSARQKIVLRSSLFFYVWQYRTDLVNNAIQLCGGGSSPGCDPMDTNVIKLSTLNLDSGLRSVYTEINLDFKELSGAEKKAVTYITNKLRMNRGCSSWPFNYCVLSDYLFQGRRFIDRMSSDPTHSFRKRMGLE